MTGDVLERHEASNHTQVFNTGFPGGNSEWEPPDPISKSEVKTLSADDSVGSPHVKVGHRQDLIAKPRLRKQPGFFLCLV